MDMFPGYMYVSTRVQASHEIQGEVFFPLLKNIWEKLRMNFRFAYVLYIITLPLIENREKFI